MAKDLVIEPIDKDEEDAAQDFELPADDAVQYEPVEPSTNALPPAPQQVDKYKDLLARATGKVPVQSRMNTGDAISALLGKNKNDLEEAKQQRNRLQLAAMLGDAGQTTGAAFAPMSGVKPDVSFTNQLLQQANQPVADVAAKQKQAQDALLEIKAQKELAAHDPNSAESIAFRKSLGQFPSIVKAFGSDFDQVSAADRENIFNLVKLKEMQETRRMQGEQIAEAKNAAREKAATDKQNQALTQTQGLLESARGNPEVQQALKDRYAASKAAALISENYDPNKMTPQQVHLLQSEVSKIATGGVPSVAEMQALNPGTLKQKFAEVSQKLLNQPTAANAGAFIKQYQTYLNDLNKNAQEVIDNKFGRVIEARKNIVGPENYKSLQEQYLNNPLKSAKKEEKKFDKDVLEYASVHNISPEQAEAIKLSRTSGK